MRLQLSAVLAVSVVNVQMTYLTAEDGRSQSSGHSPDVQRFTPSDPVRAINLYHEPGEYYENVAFTRASGSIEDCTVYFAGTVHNC